MALDAGVGPTVVFRVAALAKRPRHFGCVTMPRLIVTLKALVVQSRRIAPFLIRAFGRHRMASLAVQLGDIRIRQVRNEVAIHTCAQPAAMAGIWLIRMAVGAYALGRNGLVAVLRPEMAEQAFGMLARCFCP